VHGDEFGAPQLGDKPGEHRAVALVDRSDPDLRLVHDANYEAMINLARLQRRPAGSSG
jgi:hypothetical protein